MLFRRSLAFVFSSLLTSTFAYAEEALPVTAAGVFPVEIVGTEKPIPVTLDTEETPLLVEFVKETRARGWTHVPLMAEIDAWMQNNLGVSFDLDDPNTYGRSALAVSVQNPHPSALQHEMMCNKILIELQRSGTLERLVAGE